MSSKPPNYYQMDAYQRQAYDREQRAREDAEYELQRAREEAEQEARRAQSKERSHKEYVADLRQQQESTFDELNAARDLVQELEDEIVDLETDVEYLKDWITRSGHAAAFVAWYKTTTMNAEGVVPKPEKFMDMLASA